LRAAGFLRAIDLAGRLAFALAAGLRLVAVVVIGSLSVTQANQFACSTERITADSQRQIAGVGKGGYNASGGIGWRQPGQLQDARTSPAPRESRRYIDPMTLCWLSDVGAPIRDQRIDGALACRNARCIIGAREPLLRDVTDRMHAVQADDGGNHIGEHQKKSSPA
jgi:hypothetical protein